MLRGLTHHYLRSADRVVAIGTTMRERLESKRARLDRIRVITNWTGTAALTRQTKQSAWSREHGHAEDFVVMRSGSSGNVGHARSLDSCRPPAVPRAPTGPCQPRDLLSQSLSAAGIHVVGLAKGLSGYVVPSRHYGVLPVGRPVIVAADAGSESAKLVREVGCGVVVEPDRPDLLAAVIRKACDGDYDLEAMGHATRECVVREADRTVAVTRYRDLINEVLEERT